MKQTYKDFSATRRSYAEFMASRDALAGRRVELTERVGCLVRVKREADGEPVFPLVPVLDKHRRKINDWYTKKIAVEGADLVWAATRASRWIRGQYRFGRTPPAHIRRHIAAWAAADKAGFRAAIDARHAVLRIPPVKWEDAVPANKGS